MDRDIPETDESSHPACKFMVNDFRLFKYCEVFLLCYRNSQGLTGDYKSTDIDTRLYCTLKVQNDDILDVKIIKCGRVIYIDLNRLSRELCFC